MTLINVVIASIDLNFINAIVKSYKGHKNINIINSYNAGSELISEIYNDNIHVILIAQSLNDISPFELIIKIMKLRPTPCLFISFDTQGELIVDRPEALDYGIVDTIEIDFKGNAIVNLSRISIRLSILSKLNINKFSQQINSINSGLGRISQKVISQEKTKNKNKIEKKESKISVLRKILPFDQKNKKFRNKIIVIGASTGGPKTLFQLLSLFPRNFPPILVVQHMPKSFMPSFTNRLDTNCLLNVQLGADGMEIKRGNIYVAPGGLHMKIYKESGKSYIRTYDGEKVNFVKPAVDVTFKSVASYYGNKTIAVILTGMGKDGSDGCKEIKNAGGQVLALNEEDSVIYGMNKEVVRLGLADKVLSIKEIAKELQNMVYY